MTNKAILLSAGLILTGKILANEQPVIHSNELGCSLEHKNKTFEANDIDGLEYVFKASELNCAYGYSLKEKKRKSKKRIRKRNRNDRREKRKHN